MRHVMFAAAFVLTGAVATAEDPKPAAPAQPPVQPRPAIQPVQPRPIVVSAARLAQLEEDVEVLEATRDVKKAHVKIAEIGVRGAEVTLDRMSHAAKANAVAKDEVDKAKIDVEMAKANVEVRVAELKEVEVKIKHAKKRLDDAKAGGVRPVPVPPVRPVPVDPTPNVRFADEKATAELKAKLAEVEAKLAKNADASKKADAQVKVAEEELAKILEVAKLGRIRAGTIEAAEAKVKDAKDVAEKLAKEKKTLEATAADLRAKLKEIEK